MASASNTIRRAVAAAGEKVSEVAWTVGRDPRRERRLRRRWGLVQTATSVAFTLAARRLAAAAWRVLTGETPPTGAGAERERRDDSR